MKISARHRSIITTPDHNSGGTYKTHSYIVLEEFLAFLHKCPVGEVAAAHYANAHTHHRALSTRVSGDARRFSGYQRSIDGTAGKKNKSASAR